VTDKEMGSKIRAGNFVENNGRVLRAINILRTKYNKLSGIKYALNINEGEVADSVNFLHEEGYIHLRVIENKAPSSLADASFDMLEAKLTSKGIRLLAGGLSDNCINI